MAEQKKISALPLATEVKDGDVFVGVQDGVTRRFPASLKVSTSDLADDTDPTKGSARVGYEGGTVADQLGMIKRDAAINARMFSREKLLEVGFRDTTYDQLISTYGYSYLYPQQLAIDELASELWILKRSSGGSNTWAWIWVYDLTTLAIKTVFSTGESWKECLVLRRVGAIRYAYTVGNNNDVIRFNVTTLPANLSVGTVADRYPVSAYSQIAFDGSNWFVQDARTDISLSRRHKFNVYDAEFANRTGRFDLPLDSIGTIQAYIDYFPHMQATCMHKGALYASVGGAYVPASNFADRAKPYYLQGLHAFSATGEKLASALSEPEGFVSKMSQLCGYTTTVAENEGVASTGTDLYTCWVTLGPIERVLPEYSGKGVLIAREFAKGIDRVDFSATVGSCKTVLDLNLFSTTVWSDSVPLLNPVTGVELNSFATILDMMIQLGISKYSFGGSGQTLTDANGVAVAVTGRLVVFETTNGFTFLVRISDVSGNVVQYGLSGATQSGPYNQGSEFVSNASGYGFKHPSGHMELILTDATGIACATATGASFMSAQYTWTYPVPFVGDRPTVRVSGCYPGRTGDVAALPGYASAALIVYSTVSDATSRIFQASASGRWK